VQKTGKTPANDIPIDQFVGKEVILHCRNKVALQTKYFEEYFDMDKETTYEFVVEEYCVEEDH